MVERKREWRSRRRNRVRTRERDWDRRGEVREEKKKGNV